MESVKNIFSLSKSNRIWACKCFWSWWPGRRNRGDNAKDREEYGIRVEINKE